MYVRHAEMIAAALVMIFDFNSERAHEEVGKVFRRYANREVSQGTRDRFVHEDPVNVAAEIANVPWSDIEDHQRAESDANPDGAPSFREPYLSKIRRYNEEVRKPYERDAAEHYEKQVQPAMQKLGLG